MLPLFLFLTNAPAAEYICSPLGYNPAARAIVTANKTKEYPQWAEPTIMIDRAGARANILMAIQQAEGRTAGPISNNCPPPQTKNYWLAQ